LLSPTSSFWKESDVLEFTNEFYSLPWGILATLLPKGTKSEDTPIHIAVERSLMPGSPPMGVVNDTFAAGLPSSSVGVVM